MCKRRKAAARAKRRKKKLRAERRAARELKQETHSDLAGGWSYMEPAAVFLASMTFPSRPPDGCSTLPTPLREFAVSSKSLSINLRRLQAETREFSSRKH